MRLQTSHRARPGKILVLTALVLTTLLGFVGLTVDSGLLQTARRQVQNAADSGALAAAMELFRGNTLANAVTVATSYIQKNGLSGNGVSITVQVPQTGPYKNNPNYVEVIVSAPQAVYLMPLLGVSPTQTVAARAVAGFEAVTSGEGAIVLDPVPGPSLTFTGNAGLTVNGAVVVNSSGGGKDQYGNTVPGPGTSVSTKNSNNTITANYALVHGGVTDPTIFVNYVSGGPNPLFANSPAIVPNPLRNLPVPTDQNGAIVDAQHQFGAVSPSRAL
jgi:hypothetical protein